MGRMFNCQKKKILDLDKERLYWKGLFQEEEKELLQWGLGDEATTIATGQGYDREVCNCLQGQTENGPSCIGRSEQRLQRTGCGAQWNGWVEVAVISWQIRVVYMEVSLFFRSDGEGGLVRWIRMRVGQSLGAWRKERSLSLVKTR